MLTKKVFFGLLLLFILSLIPLYAIGFYDHPSVDDYFYGTLTADVWSKTQSLGSVLHTAWNETGRWYNEWQGNFIAVFLMYLQPGIFGEGMYFITPFILITTFVLASYFFFYTAFRLVARTDFYRASFLAVATTFISMQLLAVPSDSFYWFNGSIYYTFFYGLMLAMFGLIIWGYYRPSWRIACGVGAVLLAFVVGGGNYATSFFSVIVLGLCFAACIRKKDRPCMAIMGIVVIACVASFVVSVVAPGNAFRQSAFSDGAGLMKGIAFAVAYGCYSLAAMLNAPTIIFVLCVIPVFYEMARKLPYSYGKPLVVLIVTFILYCSCGFPVFYATGLRIPHRMANVVYFLSYVFVLFNVFYACGYAAKKYEGSALLMAINTALLHIRQNRKRALSLLGVCGFLFLGACVGRIAVSEDPVQKGKIAVANMPMTLSALYSIATGEAAQYHQELMERDAYLRSTDFENVPLRALTVKPMLIYHTDVTTDSEDWRNTHLAQFYHKLKVWIEE